MTPVAIIFPGQGAQHVGMGKEFYETSKEAKEIFDKADTVINGLTSVIFNGPQEKLTSTAFCQPAIFTFSIAALKAFEKHPRYQNINIKYACGLSLGECTAVCASGVLEFEDALRMVERRSFYMEEAARIKKGVMAAIIGFDPEKLKEICRQSGAQVANFNSPEQIVITGDTESVKKASAAIEAQGAKRVIPLDVSGAFHSNLMEPAAGPFTEELEKLSFNNPLFPVVSNVDGRPASEPSQIKSNLAKQITSSVQWVDSINTIASKGVKRFLEIGPGSVLKGLMRKINPELKVFSIEKPQDIENLP